MKKLNKSITIVLCTIFMVAFLSTQVWAITLSFNPSASEIDVGGLVDIDIVISDMMGNDNLTGFNLIFNYEDSILAFDSYTLGTELGAPDLSLDWSSSNNLIEISWISPTSDFWSNQPDSFTLATISFTGISGGHSDLSFSILTLSDDSWPAGELPDVTLETGSVDVAPVPEPATMLLFGTGLVGLVGFRKKFKK